MRVGVLTGGGDCPGLNAVIRGAVLTLTEQGHEPLAIRHGWKGLLEQESAPLRPEDVVGIERTGGTILGTSRTNPVKDAKTRETALAGYKSLALDGLIAIGGDDTLGACAALAETGIRAVGVPKTIDNDLPGTDVTFGFDTATNIVMEALDRLHTTAASHERILVAEIMGRHAGWITLHGGLAGGAHVVLLPEEPFDLDAVADVCRKRRQEGHGYTLVAASEGALPKDAKALVTQDAERDEFGNVRLGGIGKLLAKELEAKTGQEARHVVLGHLQRGGAPSAYDRVLGLRMGVAAGRAVLQEKFGVMVSLRGTDVVYEPLSQAAGDTRTVPEARIAEKKALTWGP